MPYLFDSTASVLYIGHYQRVRLNSIAPKKSTELAIPSPVWPLLMKVINYLEVRRTFTRMHRSGKRTLLTYKLALAQENELPIVSLERYNL